MRFYNSKKDLPYLPSGSVIIDGRKEGKGIEIRNIGSNTIDQTAFNFIEFMLSNHNSEYFDEYILPTKHS